MQTGQTKGEILKQILTSSLKHQGTRSHRLYVTLADEEYLLGGILSSADSVVLWFCCHTGETNQ